MNSIWNLTIEEYLEIVKRAKEDGVKPGESIEKYVIEYMNIIGKKPLGHTELSKKELIKEYNSHNKKVMEIDVDKEGKSTYKFYEGKK